MATYHYKAITCKHVKNLVQVMSDHGKDTFTMGSVSISIADLLFIIDHQPISLIEQQCHYGGVRYYFECPACQRKCYKLLRLYKVSNVLGQSVNYDAAYACTKCYKFNRFTLNRTKSDPNYYYHQAFKEARKIDPDMIEPEPFYQVAMCFPFKPKRMRQATYNKHRERFNHYMSKAQALDQTQLNKVMEWIDQLKQRLKG